MGILKAKFALISLCALLLSACNTTDGVGQYRVQSIGKAQRTTAAVVLSTRPVVVIEETTGAGANAGAAMGGALALDNSDSAAVLVAGIIAGSIIGDAIEAEGNTHNATEYVLQTEHDMLLTVAQINENNEIFSAGDKVVLVYGTPHKLIRDPR